MLGYIIGAIVTIGAFFVGFIVRSSVTTSRREPPPLAREEIKNIVERAIILHDAKLETDEIISEIDKLLGNK